MHPIRAQPNRPSVVSGKPVMNYFYPQANQEAQPNVEDHKQQVDQQLLQRLQADVSEWDPSEFLPPATFTWCYHQLQEIGRELTGESFNPEDPLTQLRGDRYQPFRVVYEELRRRAIGHFQSGAQPTLDVCSKPHGAYSWSPDTEEEAS